MSEYFNKYDITGVKAEMKEVIRRHVAQTVQYCTKFNAKTMPRRLLVKGQEISEESFGVFNFPKITKRCFI